MITRLLGTYTGTGTWFEDSGRTCRYVISQTITRTPDGFRFAFHHTFENDDPEVDAVFDMVWSTGPLFLLKAGGTELGRGYVLDGFCHYTVELPGNLVEVSCLKTETGLKVWGSASRNKAGHAIAWTETLTG
ncbi:MAG: hypothetical protein KDA53_01885 [Hyphomonas sp.]|nr:hypothetical protein [Hyphomonas sp.]